MNRQLGTDLDVRRSATQQDMHAAVMLAREEQGQKRATDEAGGAGEESGAWCVVHEVTLPATPGGTGEAKLQGQLTPTLYIRAQARLPSHDRQCLAIAGP